MVIPRPGSPRRGQNPAYRPSGAHNFCSSPCPPSIPTSPFSCFCIEGNARQTVCKPGSVPDTGEPGRGMAIHLGRPLPDASRDLPGRRHGNLPAGLTGVPPLFGLAPGGVYHAGPVAGAAVRSYRTLSPLPSLAEASEGGLLSVALSLGSPPPGITRHRVSMEPGLSSPRRSGRRPSDRLVRLLSYACAAAASTRARSASSRATVSRSIRPSIRAGRKWRWNASTTLIVVRSRMPLSSTA